MPRIQTPKNYYTATEVKKILNISDAMVRHYVQKGKIKYLVPPERKQGFYLKKDVDKLANDLHIFLNLDEETPSRFMRAGVADLPEIMEISRQLFGGGDQESRVTPLEQRIAFMEKNPDIFYILKKEEEVIGFTYMLPFKIGTDKVEQLLRSNFAGEVDMTLDDIEEFKPGKHVELYVVAIGMKPSVKYPQKRIYASRLISNLMDVIVETGKKGVVIETITAIGFSTEGRRLLQSFGFSEIPPRVPGKRAFQIKIAESGAPLMLQYKRALQENLDIKSDIETERKPRTMRDTSGQNGTERKTPTRSTSQPTKTS